MSSTPDQQASGPQGRPDVSPTGRTNVAAIESAYQLALWLIPVLEGLPRRQKFQLGERMQTVVLDVQDALVQAAYHRPQRAECLRQANLGLEKLRLGLRLCKDLGLFNFKQYEHAARLIDALGRQVGGWLRSEGGARQRTHGAAASGFTAPEDGHAAPPP